MVVRESLFQHFSLQPRQGTGGSSSSLTFSFPGVFALAILVSKRLFNVPGMGA